MGPRSHIITTNVVAISTTLTND